MMLSNMDFEAIKAICQHCEINVLIIDVFGEARAYLSDTIRLPNTECPYGEVFDAKDITTLVLNRGINFAAGINRQILEERTQSINKETFKFNSPQYYLFTKVEINR